MPKWNTISISGYHIREAGSTAVQEVAFTLADGIAYVEAAVKAGLDVDDFAAALSFFFNAHNNLLEEVAKFRAARRLWARIMKERFKAKDPRSLDAALPHPDRRLHAHRAAAGQQRRAGHPAGAGGGAGRHPVAAHQLAATRRWRCPPRTRCRIALRTQQIIANESGVADVIDPLGGSWAVEAMTDEIEGKARRATSPRSTAWAAWSRPSRKGFVQREIQDAAYAWQRQVEDEGAGGGGRERLPGRRPAGHGDAGRPGAGGRSRWRRLKAFRARARRHRREAGGRRGASGCEGHRQPDAAHPGRGEGQRHAGGDLRRHAGRLRRVPGDGGSVADW